MGIALQQAKDKSLFKNRDVFDLTKVILSICIVAIHSGIFPNILYPWLRLAVPLFFIISSYFTFIKLNEATAEQRWSSLLRTCKRLFQLYLFWTIVLSPIVITKFASRFNHGVVQGIQRVISEILFSSTFAASWYLVASIQALLLIMFFKTYKIGKYDNAFIVVSCFFFLICCLRSGYYCFIEDYSWVNSTVTFYERLVANPVFSFPIAVFWMQIGRLFAENRIVFSKTAAKLLCVLSATALFFEWRWISNVSGELYHDCLFFLAPLSISIFYLINTVDITLRYPNVMRKVSTIVYCSHASVIFVIRKVAEYLGYTSYSIVEFSVTILVCSCICALILSLENRERFQILKYSH